MEEESSLLQGAFKLFESKEEEEAEILGSQSEMEEEIMIDMVDEGEEIKRKRGRKNIYFANIAPFKGSQFLKKATPTVTLIRNNQEDYEEEEKASQAILLIDYFEDDLKKCLIDCSKSIKKTKEIIAKKIYSSLFIPQVQLSYIYMSMLEKSEASINKYYFELTSNLELIAQQHDHFKKQFIQNADEEKYAKFIQKKRARIVKHDGLMNTIREFQYIKNKHSKIWKERKYSHYTQIQIQQTASLIQEYNFKSYDKIAGQIGVKVPMIKKIASRIRSDTPLRKDRQKIDSVNSFTQEEKNEIIQEAVSDNYISLNLAQKCKRFNSKFGKEICYFTYRNLLFSQGFRYKSMMFSPVKASHEGNKLQILKTSLHIIENLQSCDDALSIDESGLNEKCFSTYFWTTRGTNPKITRDVRLKKHSLIMLISRKQGTIAYQIKQESYNSGYFLHF